MLPIANGRASVANAAIASVYDTGSPGVSHASTFIGTLAEYIAGISRSISSRRMRRSTNTESSCMRRGYAPGAIDPSPNSDRLTGTLKPADGGGA